MKTRIGKIGRLPKAVREELNRRIENGELGTELTAWINELPEVKKVLAEQFAGEAISESNLSRWKDGGYVDWYRHREMQEQMQWMTERSQDLREGEGQENLCERVAQVATAELALQLQELGDIEDPSGRWKRLREISQELWRLRNGTNYRDGVRLSWKRWEREETMGEAKRLDQVEGQETLEEMLGRLMDIVHNPRIRKWVRTDWPSKEAETRELHALYGVKPGDTNPCHPMFRDRKAQRRQAVYKYPGKRAVDGEGEEV